MMLSPTRDQPANYAPSDLECQKWSHEDGNETAKRKVVQTRCCIRRHHDDRLLHEKNSSTAAPTAATIAHGFDFGGSEHRSKGTVRNAKLANQECY